jgi:sodium/potassium-transporting ATPase subunit alpha
MSESTKVDPKQSATADIRFTEHKLTLVEFAREFATSRVDARDAWLTRGLTDEEAVSARAQHGSNVLTPPKVQSSWLLFAKQFTNWFMVLLNAAGVLGLIAFLIDTTVLINRETTHKRSS